MTNVHAPRVSKYQESQHFAQNDLGPRNQTKSQKPLHRKLLSPSHCNIATLVSFRCAATLAVAWITYGTHLRRYDPGRPHEGAVIMPNTNIITTPTEIEKQKNQYEPPTGENGAKTQPSLLTTRHHSKRPYVFFLFPTFWLFARAAGSRPAMCRHKHENSFDSDGTSLQAFAMRCRQQMSLQVGLRRPAANRCELCGNKQSHAAFDASFCAYCGITLLQSGRSKQPNSGVNGFG